MNDFSKFTEQMDELRKQMETHRDQMMDLGRQMFERGQEMAGTMGAKTGSFEAPDFSKMMPTMPKDLMEMFWGNTVNKDGLNAKTRLLVTIAGMTAQAVPVEPVFKMTVCHALEAGASKQEILEVIAQMSMLVGLPGMTRAQGFAQEVFNDEGEGA